MKYKNNDKIQIIQPNNQLPTIHVSMHNGYDHFINIKRKN